MVWQQRISERQKELHLTNKQIAEFAGMSVRSVERILYHKDDHKMPNDALVTTALKLGAAVGLSGRELFEDSACVVVDQRAAELKAELNVVRSELEAATADNIELKVTIAALNAEISLLKLKLEHREHEAAMHERYLRLLERDQ